MDNRALWSSTRDELISSLVSLGFPAELGDMIAKHIGSPKGIRRMISYLDEVRPDKPELIADEMISIRSEIDAWRERKASIRANMTYNEMLWRGWDDDDEDTD